MSAVLPSTRRFRELAPATDPAASGLRLTELRPGDTRTVLAVFDGLSERSRFQRFHVGMPALPRRWLRHLADVRPGSHQVHVGWIGGRPVGLARWIRLAGDPSAAELAVEVVDDAQGLGIGRTLVDRASRSAAGAGISSFQIFVTAGNTIVRDFAARRGATADRADRTALRVPVLALADPATGVLRR